MTEEQKQALINRCRNRIAFYKAAGNTGTFDADTLQLTEIALAALTAQPDDWKQRAEAAEAKLAELEKQKPRYQIQKRLSYGRESLWIDVASREEAENNVIHGFRWRMVYDAPTPAADLAEWVPEKASMADYYENVRSGEIDPEEAGIAMWDACRAEMLRNIEEAK